MSASTQGPKELTHIRYIASMIAGFVNGLDADESLTVAQQQIARALVQKFWAHMYETLVFPDKPH